MCENSEISLTTEIITVFASNFLESEDAFRVCFEVLRDWHLSQDVIQDIFIKFIIGKDLFNNKFCSEKNIRSFLRRSIRNKAIDLLRKKRIEENRKATIMKKNHEKLESELISEEKKEQLRHLIPCIENLSVRESNAINDFYYRKMSTKEISDLEGRPQRTIQDRLKRAKDNLKDCLNSRINDPRMTFDRCEEYLKDTISKISQAHLNEAILRYRKERTECISFQKLYIHSTLKEEIKREEQLHLEFCQKCEGFIKKVKEYIECKKILNEPRKILVKDFKQTMRKLKFNNEKVLEYFSIEIETLKDNDFIFLDSYQTLKFVELEKIIKLHFFEKLKIIFQEKGFVAAVVFVLFGTSPIDFDNV